MSDINETAAEVLRMVGQMEASCPFQPWQVGLSNNPDDPLPFIAEVGMGDVIVSGVCDENMGEFIVLCCTAAPALAREVQRLQAELLTAHRTWAERCSAWSDSVEEAEAERDEARAEVERLREMRQRGCDCNDEDACRFARERDEARAEVTRLQAERDAAHRAGQEAMRERCAALCDDWEEATYCDGWREMEQGAEHCAEAIRALEVES